MENVPQGLENVCGKRTTLGTTLVRFPQTFSKPSTYRIDHSYEEYMSPFILTVCGCHEARPRGITANVEDIRGDIHRVSRVYLTYTTVTRALGALKCRITELGVYASIYTPSYRPIRLM